LRQELRRVKPGEDIALGTATDPYQPAEKRYEVTRAILEEFARHSGLELGIVTKSNLVLRDSDVLLDIAKNNQLFVNLTITTLNTDLARILEPRAPRPDLRLDAMRKLNELGIQAGVICAPVLPSITDSPRDLEALVRATAEAGGKYIFANSLFLKPCSAAVFLPFLEQHFPHLVKSYAERFSGQSFLSQSYRRRLSQLMARLREKYGIQNKYDRYSPKKPQAPQSGQQLSLF
jgi:DNA repair photolyase